MILFQAKRADVPEINEIEVIGGPHEVTEHAGAVRNSEVVIVTDGYYENVTRLSNEQATEMAVAVLRHVAPRMVQTLIQCVEYLVEARELFTEDQREVERFVALATKEQR